MVGKFADDTTVDSLQKEDPAPNRWSCVLNTSKTIEVIVDFRKSRGMEHTLLHIHGEVVEQEDKMKILCIHIISDLTWSTHILTGDKG